MCILVSGKSEKLSSVSKFKDSITVLHLLLQDQVSSVHLSSAVSLSGLM